MPDARLPDHWLGDPRFDGLSDAGWRILTHGYMWANRHLTDGRVPKKSLRHLGTNPDDEALIELVEMQLIHLDEGAIYLNWDAQTTRDEFLGQREATRKRVSAHREKQKQLLGNGVTHSVTNGVSRRGEARRGEDLTPYSPAEPDEIF